MTTADLLELIVFAVLGGFAGVGIGVIYGRARDSWRRRNAERKHARALAKVQPFIAANGHLVEVTACPCPKPDCKGKLAKVTTANGSVVIDMPAPGNAAIFATILRKEASVRRYAALGDESKIDGVDAIAEFFDRIATVETGAKQ